MTTYRAHTRQRRTSEGLWEPVSATHVFSTREARDQFVADNEQLGAVADDSPSYVDLVRALWTVDALLGDLYRSWAVDDGRMNEVMAAREEIAELPLKGGVTDGSR